MKLCFGLSVMFASAQPEFSSKVSSYQSYPQYLNCTLNHALLSRIADARYADSESSTTCFTPMLSVKYICSFYQFNLPKCLTSPELQLHWIASTAKEKIMESGSRRIRIQIVSESPTEIFDVASGYAWPSRSSKAGRRVSIEYHGWSDESEC